jgi:hypothetical protein
MVRVHRILIFKHMANLHKDFLSFDNALNIPKGKLKQLKTSEANIKRHIKSYLTEKKVPVPTLIRQGSFVLGTLIRTKTDICDIDFGVRFFPDPQFAAPTLQKYIRDALAKVPNSTLPKHKDKCIRLHYKAGYHIDVTVYIQTNFSEPIRLATKNGWLDSNPSGFKKWVESKGERQIAQLKRLIRYTKAWADQQGKNMPKGVALTTLIAKDFVPHSRDDLSLLYTLRNIYENLEADFCCKMPVEPFDDLLERMYVYRYSFLSRLENLIKNLEKVTHARLSDEKAKVLIKGHFGKYFPIDSKRS